MPYEKSVLFFCLLLLPVTGHSEYRAFNLKIAVKDSPDFRQVISQFDPYQYRTYYPVADNEVITYTDTWMCRGRTDHGPICPSPHVQAPAAEVSANPNDRAPASSPVTVPVPPGK